MTVSWLGVSPTVSSTVTVTEESHGRRLVLQMESDITSKRKEGPGPATRLALSPPLDALPPNLKLILRRLEVFSTHHDTSTPDAHTGPHYATAQLFGDPSVGDDQFQLTLKEDGSFYVQRATWEISPASTVQEDTGLGDCSERPSTRPDYLTTEKCLKRLWFSAPSVWLDSRSVGDSGCDDFDASSDVDSESTCQYTDDCVNPLSFCHFLLLLDCVKEHRRAPTAGSPCLHSLIDEMIAALEVSGYCSVSQYSRDELNRLSIDSEGPEASAHASSIAASFLAKQRLEECKIDAISIKRTPNPTCFDYEEYSTVLAEEWRHIYEQRSRFDLERRLLKTQLKQILMETEEASEALNRLCVAVDSEISGLGFVEDVDLKNRALDTVRRLEQIA